MQEKIIMRHRIKGISDTPVKSLALCGAIYAELAPVGPLISTMHIQNILPASLLNMDIGYTEYTTHKASYLNYTHHAIPHYHSTTTR